MKIRISATVDKETLKIIKEILKEGKHRNKSHIIEEAIKLLKKGK
ncbi:MAG: ribbon-helix-helix domain-containing protein [Nanoarchaeota archaeon]|nr:ribbon-helix-helix domain-containing protein [Nanoarchaeota archaeon]